VARDGDLSIANISSLTDKMDFLLQVSKKSTKLDSFIKDNIPGGDKNWLSDLKSWKFNNKWLLQISDICLADYDQVFYDCGEELLDLNEAKDYQTFREKILEELM